MKITISQEGYNPVTISTERSPAKYNRKKYNTYIAPSYVGTFCNSSEANSFMQILNNVTKYSEDNFINLSKKLISHAVKSIINDKSTLWNNKIKPRLHELYQKLIVVFSNNRYAEIGYDLENKMDTIQNHGNIDYYLLYKEKDKVSRLDYTIRIINID